VTDEDIDWLFELPPPKSPPIGRSRQDNIDEEHLDFITYAVWGDAMLAAMQGDNRELVRMLRGRGTVTRDVREFVAYLLEKPTNPHRTELPDKFKVLHEMIRHQKIPREFAAALECSQMMAAWAERHGDRPRFPRARVLQRLADKYKLFPRQIEKHLKKGKEHAPKPT
jgi:hypothetical protein